MTDRSHAVDVTTLKDRPPRSQIIDGLWPLHSFLGIVAEEGDGKTLISEQLCRQMLRGERVLGFFDLGDARPLRILYVDTEMEEDDAKERDDEARNRGLEVASGQFYWYSPGGLVLDDDRDLAIVERELERVRPDLLWIDSGINAVSEAEEGTPVKKFFNCLSHLMRRHDLVGIGLCLHPRKRPQGAGERRFDDLFGSREWKGRLNTALYLEGNRITSWKNRGGRLNTMWRKEPGKSAYAILNRPGLADPTAVPFTITVPEEASEADREAIEAKVREILTQRPDQLTKTALAKEVGGRYGDALAVVNRPLDKGIVIPKQDRAKLRLDDTEAVFTWDIVK